MFCGSCGREINEQAKFCPYCGNPAGAETEQNEKNFSFGKRFQGTDKFDFKMNPGEIWKSMFPSGNPAMNWYQFLIWGYLLFMAFFELITGARYLIYFFRLLFSRLFMGGILAVSFIYVIFALGMAVSAIYVRQRLVQFKADGPKLFLIWVGIFTVGNVLLIVWVAAMTSYGMSQDQAETVLLWIISGCLMIPLNYIYFKKRNYLFCR